MTEDMTAADRRRSPLSRGLNPRWRQFDRSSASWNLLVENVKATFS
jgi:hypothetical protein